MAALNDSVMQTASIQNLEVSGSSSQSSSITGSSGPYEIVRIATTAGCYLAFGANPTANAASGEYWPADSVEYKKLNSGDKVAFIQASEAGRITISRMV
jgi:hypothetical protein